MLYLTGYLNIIYCYIEPKPNPNPNLNPNPVPIPTGDMTSQSFIKTDKTAPIYSV